MRVPGSSVQAGYSHLSHWTNPKPADGSVGSAEQATLRGQVRARHVPVLLSFTPPQDHAPCLGAAGQRGDEDTVREQGCVGTSEEAQALLPASPTADSHPGVRTAWGQQHGGT